jgi:threonylcarbamoyladenosine tRNA methylthiotransferase CDKAL1
MQTDLIEAYKNDKIFKFLHLPIQSGDDQTLKRMRRFYTVKEYVAIVEAFRHAFPDLTLSTDIIVGFPGETEEAFQNTLEILKRTKPDITNVSKFFARPKTPAAQIREGLVDKSETKRRSTITAELTKQLSAEQNKRWIGWVGSVLIDEKGKKLGSWVGRNYAYKPVVVRSSQNLLDKTVDVKIVSASGTYLLGNIE